MKILILGGMGFVGRNLHHHLSQKHEVTILDNMDGRLESPRFAEIYPEPDFIKTSIFNYARMEELVSESDVVINCVGQTSHPISMADPLYDIRLNVEGSLTVLEVMRNCNPKGFLIYLSSSTVVGPYIGDYWGENTQENPIDIYSANKLVAEKYHDIYRRAYDLRVMVIRCPNLFGPHGKNSPEFGFVNYFIGQALAGEKITVYGLGKQLRNVVYIEDVNSEIDYLLTHRHVSPMIMHRKNSLSVGDIATVIAGVFGANIVNMDYPENRKRLEIGNVRIHVPWGAATWGAATWSLRDGLEDMKTKIAKEAKDFEEFLYSEELWSNSETPRN